MRDRLALGAATTALASPAFAQSRFEVLGNATNSHEAFILSGFVGVVLFATTVALLHLNGRRKTQQREGSLITQLNDVRARLDRAETFLAVEPQITIVWGLQDGEPEIEGAVDLVTDAPMPRRVLGFGSWLAPGEAQKLEACVTALRERGESFRLSVGALNGRHLEVDGRAVGGRAVMRIREVSGDRLEALRLHEGLISVQGQLDATRALFNAIPHPTWTRDALGRLDWLNAAYAKAVEAVDARDALARGIEVLETPTREASAMSRQNNETFRARTAAVMRGWRSVLDVVEVPHHTRAIGIAFDVSDLEKARADLKEVQDAHARTLDQLATAVAIFDRRKQLVFHNAAYRQLWSLDTSFLEPGRSETEILERLRTRRMLPEQADFRAWKEMHLAGYQSPETSEQTWHLPDGRVVRVVINPNPQSGVTYLFDDVTAQYRLEIMINAQTRVQSETLDTLKEGVAVFGTDGRLKLSNAAFAKLWRIDGRDLSGNPHVERVSSLCSLLASDPEPWIALKTAVTGFHDERTGLARRIACKDGTIFDCMAAPLPDGATLLTFTDTTASVNVERALTERNQALLDTEQIRRDFVNHVSYELRLPLTNVIGFIQLLASGQFGSLNPKQSEYVGYVMKSSMALLAITDSILDLATIEMGAFELTLEDVDVLEEIRAASEGVQDRIADHHLHLQIVALPNIGSFRADRKRLRQVLYNLLSNAVGFSAPNQTVTLAALRRGDEIVFKVTDQGRGVPNEIITRVFDRDQAAPIGSRNRGTGLSFSIIKSFVELHGGRVLLDTAPGEGTTVTCIFPVRDETVKRLGASDGSSGEI